MSSPSWAFPPCLLLLLAPFLAACGNSPAFSSSNPGPTPSNGSVAVMVTPSTANIRAGSTYLFSATVTGSANTLVSWSVDSTPGGSSTVGTIDSSGHYTAPTALPSPHTVSATAPPPHRDHLPRRHLFRHGPESRSRQQHFLRPQFSGEWFSAGFELLANVCRSGCEPQRIPSVPLRQSLEQGHLLFARRLQLRRHHLLHRPDRRDSSGLRFRPLQWLQPRHPLRPRRFPPAP